MSEQLILKLELQLKALESFEEAIIAAQTVLDNGAILAFQDPGTVRTVTGDMDGALKLTRDEINDVKKKLQGAFRVKS